MRVSRLAAVLGTVAVAGVLPGAARPVAGQSATYHSSTHFHMAGALGSLISHAAGSGGNGGVTTYIEGHRMRTDDKDHSMIIDVDGGRIIQIYKDRKVYSSMTFEQFADVMRQAQARMKEEMAKQSAQQQQQYAASTSKPHDDIEWNYQVSSEKTGEHEQIAGYSAERQFITLTATARDKTQPDSGSLVVLMDIWTSQDAPNGPALREFQRAYAAKARATFEPPMKGMMPVMSVSPQFRAALEAAGKELHKVQGTQLRTTTYLVGVPGNMKFDRSLVISGAGASQQNAQSGNAPKQGGLKGLFGKVKAAAQQAEQNQHQNQKAAEQGTILWFTTELDDIQPHVPAGAFAIPAGYTQVPATTTLPNN